VEPRALKHLTPAECVDLASRESVGRVVFVDDEGPAALPVNYVLTDDTHVLFRLDDGSMLHAVRDQRSGFEVDAVDHEAHVAWSVLFRGQAREMDLEDVAKLLHEIHERFPQPWAGGVHNHWVLLTIDTATGRRLEGHDAPLVF
jgi:nitroimidazol reductase NimA-like FMN-containing flavoprotein (pyridoxamine 5'-phosphate oxidase superfamily)